MAVAGTGTGMVAGVRAGCRNVVRGQVQVWGEGLGAGVESGEGLGKGEAMYKVCVVQQGARFCPCARPCARPRPLSSVPHLSSILLDC